MPKSTLGLKPRVRLTKKTRVSRDGRKFKFGIIFPVIIDHDMISQEIEDKSEILGSQDTDTVREAPEQAGLGAGVVDSIVVWTPAGDPIVDSAFVCTDCGADRRCCGADCRCGWTPGWVICEACGRAVCPGCCFQTPDSCYCSNSVT